MKLISWNVNGIRACINKGFIDFLEKENPEVIGLQEIKAKIEQVDKKDLEKIESMGYKIYFNSAVKPGYSGTSIITKIEPLNIYNGIDTATLELDEIETDEVIEENHEGRVLTAEFEDFYFVTVYTPNSKTELERLDYRQIWDRVFLKYLKKLEEKKPVIICGDLNVAHKEIDLTHPKANKRNAGFTQEERTGMDNYVEAGFIDTFRYFYPEKTCAYSWWSYFGKAREKNVGWRIDYFLTSNSFSKNLKDSFILPEVLGSDHCPVGIILK